MNPYREDGACQECLKRKVKSPMRGDTLQMLHSVLLIIVVALLVTVDAECWIKQVWAPAVSLAVISLGVFISGLNYISGRQY
jgi:hypothetical protein